MPCRFWESLEMSRRNLFTARRSSIIDLINRTFITRKFLSVPIWSSRWTCTSTSLLGLFRVAYVSWDIECCSRWTWLTFIYLEIENWRFIGAFSWNTGISFRVKGFSWLASFNDGFTITLIWIPFCVDWTILALFYCGIPIRELNWTFLT